MSVRFAVLGAGRIGQIHAHTIAAMSDATLVAISDLIEPAAAAVASRHGCEVRTLDSIETSEDVHAVVICTPTDTHSDLIMRFARAGKAIFCEKPVDLSIERVVESLAVVEETGTALMVGFQRRFDPDFLALRQVIDEGRIGDVEMIALTSRDPGPPPYDYLAHSGGIFRDMTIHDLDMARWLLDEEIQTVQAAGSVLVDRRIGEFGDYDSANIILSTASGRQCTISNSRRARYGYDQRIEVHGSAGMANADNHRTSRVTVAAASGSLQPPLVDFFISRYAAAYAAEMTAFVRALADNTAMPTTGHDGLMALVLAEAATRAAQDRRVLAVTEV